MPHLTTYKATRTVDGLLVEGVIMAVTGKPSGRPEVTSEMLAGFVVNFDKRMSRGSIGAYVLLDHGGPRVGRIVALSVQGNQLLGDLLITEAEVADRVEESDLTDISISFFPEDQVLVDVSLLDNGFGVLADSIPPLLVDVQQDFGLPADKIVQYKYAAPTQTTDSNTGNTKELTMELTPEQLEEMIAKAVEKRLASTPAADEPVNEKSVKDALAKLAKKEIDITVDGYVRNLVSRGGYSGAGLKARFAAFGENTTAMEVEYKRLMEKSNDDVKLEMETEYEAPKLDDELKVEWEDYKARSGSTMDFALFCQLAKREGRADLSSKPINTLPGSISL